MKYHLELATDDPSVLTKVFDACSDTGKDSNTRLKPMNEITLKHVDNLSEPVMAKPKKSKKVKK